MKLTPISLIQPAISESVFKRVSTDHGRCRPCANVGTYQAHEGIGRFLLLLVPAIVRGTKLLTHSRIEVHCTCVSMKYPLCSVLRAMWFEF